MKKTAVRFKDLFKTTAQKTIEDQQKAIRMILEEKRALRLERDQLVKEKADLIRELDAMTAHAVNLENRIDAGLEFIKRQKAAMEYVDGKHSTD